MVTVFAHALNASKPRAKQVNNFQINKTPASVWGFYFDGTGVSVLIESYPLFHDMYLTMIKTARLYEK
ncbi:MAG: hypothetical protein NUV61_02710 [Candidatus Azambacteria bacterium]|nr:hypothetical protein [Candidatus Azambacteria bacterium]